MDMKGLSIKKTTVAKELRKDFTEILEENILKEEKINIKKILDKYDELSDQIKQSLLSGSVEYTLPKNIEPIETYEKPDNQDAVRATIIWNALEPDRQIVPPEKINFLKLNCNDPNDPRLVELEKTHPDKYEAIMKTVFNYGVDEVKIDISRFGFTCIGIPKDVDVIPDYLRPFINYPIMENDNMKNGYILLESLGVYVEEVKDVKYKSNLVQI